MKRFYALLVLALCLVAFSAQPCDREILGLWRDGARDLRNLEKEFDSLLRADNIGNWIRQISARPHHVGSEYTREVVRLLEGLFQSWGYQTQVEEYQVLFPTPVVRLVEMLQPVSYRARLEEDVLPEDSTSGQVDEQLPVYNAYSIDGDVTAELVYVNYGRRVDYEELDRLGIDVRGKLVIARYGASWRGIKPKVAAEHGAVGCLIYSDPQDDGYFRGDVYPEGPFRNEWGAQRGSVADMPLFPGDPLTPGVGATSDAERLPVSKAPTLTRIPVLPIAYGDALPLLRELRGPVAPASWRGALPLTYHLGPGPATVRLKVQFDWNLKPALNVIARISGATEPEQWVIRGNHHDAWVNGAADPVSGLAAMLEEARGIGELARNGWKPGRTIVYAAWDAEEPGLLGSTEWVEHHAEELKARAVVYLNSDSNGRGFLNLEGSHSLERFVNEVAREVSDPQRPVSVWDRRRAMLLARSSVEESAKIRSGQDLQIGALGSGSDYSPFLQHVGVASLNLGFGGENSGGSYHSIYDSPDHYARFGDPGSLYGVALARVAGRAVIRLASAPLLPFEFSSVSRTIETYVDELETLLERLRRETQEHNLKVQEDSFQLAADPKLTFVAPEWKDEVPFLTFAPLRNALQHLKKSSEAFDLRLNKLGSRAGGFNPSDFRELNQVLARAERTLTLDDGLPGRPWYRHFVYAPGLYTGYGVKTLPAVREAIETRMWDEVEPQVRRTAAVLHQLADQVDRAVSRMDDLIERSDEG